MLYEEVMNIRNLTIDELKEKMVSLGEKPYRANQIYAWLHSKMLDDIHKSSNINKQILEKLENNFDLDYPTIEREYISKLDETKKYLIRLKDSCLIEAVLMKYKYGYTVCVSSQVGCDMGCTFCASTIGGMKRNLEAYEILAEIYLISKKNNLKITNVVVMGSGEPLLNFDNLLKFMEILNSKDGQNISLRNITISTCGIVPNIYKLAELELPLTLALSLHAPNDKIRNTIMPVSRQYSLDKVMKAMADYFVKTNRRITFEYALIDGVNSSLSNATELIKLFEKSFKGRHIDFNVNLIPVNAVKENEYVPPKKDDINMFKDALIKAGIDVTIRRELGKDISGSCGQLRASVK